MSFHTHITYPPCPHTHHMSSLSLTHSSLFVSLSDDFLGATSTSRLDFTPPLEDPARMSLSPGASTPQVLTPPQISVSPSASQGAFSPGNTSDVTPSLSSDSVSLPTQLEAQPSPVPTPVPTSVPASPPQPLAQELSLRLSEASLEEVNVEENPEEQQQQQQTREEQKSAAQPEVVTDGPTQEKVPPAAPTTRTETNKEDGPQDLRVFELNSDSGKSTPSNNGKKGELKDHHGVITLLSFYWCRSRLFRFLRIHLVKY